MRTNCPRRDPTFVHHTRSRPNRVPGRLRLLAVLALTILTSSAHAAPRFEFTPTDTLHGFTFADKMPWSPRGTLLAVERAGGSDLYVYDATQPDSGPRLIDEGRGREHWSPDGTWIARLSMFPGSPFDPDTIDALAADGTSRQAIYVGPRVWPILWAADGQLFAWQKVGGPFRTLEPPDGWIGGQDLKPWPTLVLGPVEGGTLSAQRFLPGKRSRTEPIEAIDSTFGPGHKMLLDALPQHGRFLVWGRPRPMAHVAALVVDVRGNAISPPASPQRDAGRYSLTADGKAVLGAVVTGDDTEAGIVLAAELFVEDAELAWRVSVDGAGEGMKPWMSREGSFLAYEDPIHGGICIGLLVMYAE